MTIYNVFGYPNIVIKYHLHCDKSDDEPMGTSVVDYWFLKKLEGTGIAIKAFVPDVYSLTGGINPWFVSVKGASGKTETEWFNKERPIVRCTWF